MKIWQYFRAKLKSHTSITSSAHWASLDTIPLYNWEKCQEGELHYINKDHKSSESDAENWVNLYNQYIEKYGLGDQLDRYLSQKVHLAKLRLQYITTNNVFLLNNIEVAQIELEQLDPRKHDGMSTTQVLIHLSKWLGYHVNPKVITIVEFKEMLNAYVGSNKEK